MKNDFSGYKSKTHLLGQFTLKCTDSHSNSQLYKVTDQ